jgi:hypothetical protein
MTNTYKLTQELHDLKNVIQELRTDNQELKNTIQELTDENFELKNKKIGVQFENDSDKPLYLLHKIGSEIYEIQEDSNVWIDSLYEKIDRLKNDFSGKVGERFIHNICQLTNIPCNYTEDKNSTDGTYDIIINSKKIEVKTARYGKQKSFQHENLRNSGSDYYLFIDIKSNYFYMTIIPKYNLSQKCDIVEKKAHLRKGSSDVYKFDFSDKSICNSISKKFTIEINKDTSFDIIKEFINKIIQ